MDDIELEAELQANTRVAITYTLIQFRMFFLSSSFYLAVISLIFMVRHGCVGGLPGSRITHLNGAAWVVGGLPGSHITHLHGAAWVVCVLGRGGGEAAGSKVGRSKPAPC